MALTPDETQELRRIHVLAQFGDLPDTMRSRYEELRGRDEQVEIAEPVLDVEWMPVQRTRDDSLDDAIDTLLSLTEDETEDADDDALSLLSGLASEQVDTSGMSIAAMASLEATMSGNDFYVASPYTGGFAPSAWYGRA
jgi:hypothetical protein